MTRKVNDHPLRNVDFDDSHRLEALISELLGELLGSRFPDSPPSTPPDLHLTGYEKQRSLESKTGSQSDHLPSGAHVGSNCLECYEYDGCNSPAQTTPSTLPPTPSSSRTISPTLSDGFGYIPIGLDLSAEDATTPRGSLPPSRAPILIKYGVSRRGSTPMTALWNPVDASTVRLSVSSSSNLPDDENFSLGPPLFQPNPLAVGSRSQVTAADDDQGASCP